MSLNELIFYFESPIVKVLSTIIVVLVSAIFFNNKIPRYLKQLTYWLSNYYYKLYSKQRVKTDIEKILDQASTAVSLYDEMIGHYNAVHIGIYSFHNGDVSLDNIHLYKLSMIDERSRYYTLIQKNKEIPCNILIEIITHCRNHDYYELNKSETNIIFLKEQLLTLESINYVYYSIQWEDNIPSFAITIATKERIPIGYLKDIEKNRVMLHQIYNKTLEPTTHDLMKRL